MAVQKLVLLERGIWQLLYDTHVLEFSHGVAPEVSIPVAENPTQQQHSPADAAGTRGTIRRRDTVDGTVTSTSDISDIRYFGRRCLKVLLLVGLLIAIIVFLTQTYHPGSDPASTSAPEVS